jgi:probable F420-dependent oxidoreductase
VRFGVQLGVDAPTDPAALVKLARGAESSVFDSFWVGDHVIIPNTIDHSSHERSVGGSRRFADRTLVPISEPITTLAFLAGAVTTIRLGVAVLVVPLRNPVLCAKMLASVDSLSAGRLDIGVGAGWIEAEFEALSTPPYEARGAVTDDYLDTMIELWTQAEPFQEGRYSSVRHVAMLPKPPQRPHPPLWIGGNGMPALRRVARVGQGWLPLFQSPEEIVAKRARLAELCEQSGRDGAEIRIAVGCRFAFDDGLGSDRPLLTGTASQMRDDIRRYEDAGIEQVHLVTALPNLEVVWALDNWRRFADEVVGRL